MDNNHFKCLTLFETMTFIVWIEHSAINCFEINWAYLVIKFDSIIDATRTQLKFNYMLRSACFTNVVHFFLKKKRKKISSSTWNSLLACASNKLLILLSLIVNPNYDTWKTSNKIISKVSNILLKYYI